MAWVVEHLDGGRAIGEDACADVDAAIHDLLASEGSPLPFEVCEGLLGIAIYAAERLPRTRARQALERIVDLLGAANDGDGALTGWIIPATASPEWQRAAFPLGAVSTDPTHGVSGAFPVLGLAAAVGVAPTPKGG